MCDYSCSTCKKVWESGCELTHSLLENDIEDIEDVEEEDLIPVDIEEF